MSSPDTLATLVPAITADVPAAPSFNFDNTYVRLPERFHSRTELTGVAAPRLIKVNVELARILGLDIDSLTTPEAIGIFAGSRQAEGSEPLSMAYAGHQFGYFVPQLGDGRATLLGEIVSRDGIRYDVQLKGSGPTAFSRRGDGRAALGPVLREYLVSEAMTALGVPSTRALAAVTTGETVVRETLLPGAVLTRVAASHLRVGTFQYFAARGDTDAIATLADYAIARHHPDAPHSQQPYRAFLDGVISRQAHLIAQWMMLGFIHGVMNTDNTSISGETIDFGPCAFLEQYDPEKVFSSIDQNGRYAFGNQPGIALWNLTRLAECLLPVMEREAESADAALASAKHALALFQPQFEAARLTGLRRKLGLLTEHDGDLALAEDLLERMASNQADFTLTFRRLSDAAQSPQADAAVRALFTNPEAYDAWAIIWRNRIALESASPEERANAMRAANPAFIPRNHLVEAVIVAAVERNDFQPFEALLDVVTRPFADRPGLEDYLAPARPEQCVTSTFCGT